ncbi:MAG TPA: hypothetical protein VHZ03_18845 [Trebonia sp.]|nr:hypothetical protein [Trebonia sp.]
MNCLECATTIDRSTMAQPAIGCCAYCGAGMCLDHARYIRLTPPPPAGLVPSLWNGRRRIVCTTCDEESGAGRLTISMLGNLEEDGDGPVRRGWSAFISGLTTRDSRPRRPGPAS